MTATRMRNETSKLKTNNGVRAIGRRRKSRELALKLLGKDWRDQAAYVTGKMLLLDTLTLVFHLP